MPDRVSLDYYGAMREALAEAMQAPAHGDVPVGAVVHDGKRIIARAHNIKERDQDPCGHAEVVALRAAAKALGTWHLGGHTLVVTLEPCAMCAGALVHARVDTVVYGASDAKAGALRSVMRLGEHPSLNHRLEIVEGIMEAECGEVLQDFFAQRRTKPAD